MAIKKRNDTNKILMTIVSVLLLLMFLLKFDAVAKVVDPEGKLGVQDFASNAFIILLGVLLIIVGLAAAATIWVAVATIAVGVGMIAFKSYSLWQQYSPQIKQAG